MLQFGSYLVDAHLFAGYLDDAINVCDTLYYNVRAFHGMLDSHALDDHYVEGASNDVLWRKHDFLNT